MNITELIEQLEDLEFNSHIDVLGWLNWLTLAFAQGQVLPVSPSGIIALFEAHGYKLDVRLQYDDPNLDRQADYLVGQALWDLKLFGRIHPHFHFRVVWWFRKIYGFYYMGVTLNLLN